MLERAGTGQRLAVTTVVLAVSLAAATSSAAAADNGTDKVRTVEVGTGAPPTGALSMAPPPRVRRALVSGDTSLDTASDRSAAPTDPGYVPGRLIVKLNDELGNRASPGMRGAVAGFGIAEIDLLNRRYMARSIRRPFAGREARLAHRTARPDPRAARVPPGVVAPSFEHVYVLELSHSLDMEAVAREYARVPGVMYAEPDRKAHTFLTTNDPYLMSSGSWGQPFRDLWGLAKLEAQAAWDVTLGAGVTVAVIDTGVDFAHPDIAARAWTNPGEIANNGIDDDGNGYVDDVVGWDIVGGDPDPFDDFGHGTHVAGTIAATANNGVGIAGVAPQASIMALKGLDAGGGGGYSELAELILYAADNGADVINASWGGAGSSELIDDAMAAAYASGVVFVAAAGNSATDAKDFTPANNPHAIAVSAFDSTDTIAFFSNYGHVIDVAAPGGGDESPAGKFDPFRSVLSLLSTGANDSMTGSGKLVVGGRYIRQAGTSMAAPHAAGVAALILAHHPSFTVDQVRQVLRASADDVDLPGVDANSGYGRVNARKAVAIESALDVVLETPATGAVVSRNSVDVIGTVGGSDFQAYTIEYGTGDYPTSWSTIATGLTAVAGGSLATWDVAAVPDAVYTLRVRATTTFGDTFEDRATVTLDRLSITEPESYSIHRGAGTVLDVVGTAYAPGFNSYAIEWREVPPDLIPGQWRTSGITVAGGGAAPVFEGSLATFDTSALSVGRDLDFRLTVNGGNGAVGDIIYHVVVDPDLRPGWPRQIPGLPDRYFRMQGQVTLADLDGDGTKEILLGYHELVFALTADGSDFPGWPQSVAEPDADPDIYIHTEVSPAVADLDNDGRLEVVTGNSNSIFIWRYDGTPLPGWPKTLRFGDEPYAWGPPRGDFVLADLDGDGLRDIIFSVGKTLAALRSDGTYLPGWPVTVDSFYLWPPPFERVIAVGDVTADGRPEVVAVESHGFHDPQELHVFDATGTELPSFAQRVTRRNGVIPNWPVLADLDRDGALDVIVNSDKVRQLSARSVTGLPLRPLTRVPNFRLKVPGAGTFPSEQELLTAGDINGDGAPEIVVSTELQSVRVRCGAGRCTWTFLLGPMSGTNWIQLVNQSRRGVEGWPVAMNFTAGDNAHGPGSAAIGDIDGDGAQDLVFGTGMCRVEANYAYHRCYSIDAFRANGTHLPGFPKPVPSPGATRAVMPAIGDLDGDGLKEIVFVDFNGNVLVWTVPGTPGPENMQWPMFRHDAAHTGALR